MFRHAVEGKTSTNQGFRLIHKSAEVKCATGSCFPVFDDDGHAQAIKESDFPSRLLKTAGKALTPYRPIQQPTLDPTPAFQTLLPLSVAFTHETCFLIKTKLIFNFQLIYIINN